MPRHIRERRDLSWPAKAVACHLAYRQRGRSRVKVSHRTLAKYLGMALPRVRRALAEAVAAGVIRIVREKRRGRSDFYDARAAALDGESVPTGAHFTNSKCAPVGALGSGKCANGGAHQEVQGENREGRRDSPPSVHEAINGKDDEVAVPILVAAYLERATKAHRVIAIEVANRLTEDLFADRYTALNLAAYLDAHPCVTCWPRELAADIGEWLNGVNLEASERERLAAWSDWRRRLDAVAVGEVVWGDTAPPPEASDWKVLEIDAAAGRVTLLRRWSGSELIPPPGALCDAWWRKHPDGPHPYDEPFVIKDPGEGKRWHFVHEATPLLAGRGDEAKEEAQGG